MKPLTVLQTLVLMVTETQNEVTKCEILERVYTRMLIGSKDRGSSQALAMTQAKLNGLRQSLRILEDLKNEEASKHPAELIPKEEKAAA